MPIDGVAVPLLAEQIDPDQRYSVIRIGSGHYAYTTYDRFVRGLKHAWDAGLVPEQGEGAVPGAALPERAPRLRGLDPDERSAHFLEPAHEGVLIAG
jgi:hypothetical protein